MTSIFTFVNTVDSPSLSASSAKAMRAHVTKTNFANRRKRIATEGWRIGRQAPAEEYSNRLVTSVDERAQKPSSAREQTAKTDNDTDHSDRALRRKQKRRRTVNQPKNEGLTQADSTNEANKMLTRLRSTDSQLRFLHFMHHFAPMKFSPDGSPAQKPGIDLWTTLLFSEPAFYEASLAVGTSYRPPMFAGLYSTPEGHAGKAISIVNSRLSDPQTAVSDGVLAAVFTLAVWELRSGHDEIWGVHIDGLAKMITLRNTQGGENLPSWFSDLFIYNSFGVVSQAQKERYQSVLDALAASEDQPTAVNISHISTYMAQLSRGLELHHFLGMSPSSVAQEIEQPIKHLYRIANRLTQGDQPLLRASGLAIMIFLRLSWPKQPNIPLSALTHDLREALEISQFRPCSTIDFSAWKYFIGAIGSDPQSEDRRWYVMMLARLLQTIPVNTWNEVLAMLRRTFLPDVVLLGRVKEIWEECKAVRRL